MSDYPELDRTPVVDWGPGFEGTPEIPNEWSADAALIVHGPLTIEGSKTVASIVIALAERRRLGGVFLEPTMVGIELTHNDCIYLMRELSQVLA